MVDMSNAKGAASKGTGKGQDKGFLPSIATMSLGSSTLHALDRKLEIAAAKGFLGIELYWDDLVQYAARFRGKPREAVLAAASDIARVAGRVGVRIISLQPFRNFDGLTSAEMREQRLAEFELWLATARRLGADMIGVPSTLPTAGAGDYTGCRGAAAADLAVLARMAGAHGMRVAYENLCFAAHVRDWQQAWDRIELAGAPDNLLFLPDTFNLCGRTYMDPGAAGGKTPTAAEDLDASLGRLVDAVPMWRMPLLQVADAELLDSPLTRDHPWCRDGGLTPLMALSRNARLFPFEERGYLPILSVVQALVAAGWEGWVSMEVFSRTTAVHGEQTIWQHADRAWKSWEKLAHVMGWPTRPGLDHTAVVV